MDIIELQQPILDDGLYLTKFFNGRLLTAKDLDRDQKANLWVARQLSHAIGEGVAYGLEVSKSVTHSMNLAIPDVQKFVLKITKGLAINRIGQVLSLSNQVELNLSRQAKVTNNDSSCFTECIPIKTGTYVAGSGVYLLTIAPANGSNGRAPVSGLGNEAASCNTDIVIETVQFRLIQIDPFLPEDWSSYGPKLRNRLAYLCFGVTAAQDALTTTDFLTDPFSQKLQQGYGLLDQLRPILLTDCDVPLAVLYWTTSGGIEFVDMWAVRRHLTNRAGDQRWGAFIDDRRANEAESMFLQFQAQVNDLRFSNSDASLLKAREHFRYLPPIGILPETKPPSRNDLDYRLFFSGLKYRPPVFMEGAGMEALIRHAIIYRPIDLVSEELIWVYRVRENRQIDSRKQTDSPLSYVIFVSGHCPYQGNARYNIARWDFSNFATV